MSRRRRTCAVLIVLQRDGWHSALPLFDGVAARCANKKASRNKQNDEHQRLTHEKSVANTRGTDEKERSVIEERGYNRVDNRTTLLATHINTARCRCRLVARLLARKLIIHVRGHDGGMGFTSVRSRGANSKQACSTSSSHQILRNFNSNCSVMISKIVKNAQHHTHVQRAKRAADTLQRNACRAPWQQRARATCLCACTKRARAPWHLS